MRADHYTVAETVTVSGNGEPVTEPGQMDGEVVDREWVEAYTAIEARRFFMNLGGSEEFRKTKAGVITCRSTSPDRKRLRVMRFTPIKRGS